MSEIEIKNLTKIFEQKNVRVEALKNISLNIKKGDIYGIIGMSGAGKSTLVRCLNYLEKPTEGQVIVDGKDLGTLSEKELLIQRREISMIFQHFNLLQQKNVVDNIAFPLILQGLKKKAARERARELLKVVDLADKGKAYPSQLSGGQQQRVAIARALASNPKILLCDEATSALDPQTTSSILELLKKINNDLGITIVIITHSMSVVREVCNKVAIIEGGQLVEDGFVNDIFTHPKTRAAKELIFTDTKESIVEPVKQLNSKRIVRIVFSENSAFEPVISNLVLKFKAPINILLANTKNVGGVAKGEMIISLPEDEHLWVDMEAYLKERGLAVQEVSDYVG